LLRPLRRPVRGAFRSVNIIRQAFAKIPEGEIAVKVTGNPTGRDHHAHRAAAREVVYHLKANGTKTAAVPRAHPTFANLPAMLKVLPGATWPTCR